MLAVIDRLKAKNAGAGADESKFIQAGKAELQVWLTDKSPEAMAKLKELGFEVVLDPKTAKLVIGRLAIEKLSALAEAEVRTLCRAANVEQVRRLRLESRSRLSRPRVRYVSLGK